MGCVTETSSEPRKSRQRIGGLFGHQRDARAAIRRRISVADLAPAVLRPEGERIHDVSTAIETEVPETATRVLVLYRLSNGFAEETDRAGLRLALRRAGSCRRCRF